MHQRTKQSDAFQRTHLEQATPSIIVFGETLSLQLTPNKQRQLHIERRLKTADAWAPFLARRKQKSSDFTGCNP